MTPRLQERFYIYVLGPNQDSRLASVAAGAVITKIELPLDSDAPFLLRGRSVRQAYTPALTQNGLQFLSSRWTGPIGDYRQQDYVPENLQASNFGQMGSPKPIFPQVPYPASGILTVDLVNNGASAITNLMFIWWGVKLFPPGATQNYTYPPRFRRKWFNYQVPVALLGISEYRQNQIFTVHQDADFVFQAGQATAPFNDAGSIFAEVSIRLMDADKKPYMNDLVPLDVLFGSGNFPATIPYGSTPTYLKPFGPGPALPGLTYPEIYVPKNQQLLYDLQRTDGTVHGAATAENPTLNFIGGKVFSQ